MKINVREDYHSEHAKLSLSATPSDPSELFKAWYTHTQSKQPKTANIMFITTVSPNHRPSTRAVLLREYQNNQYVFYTHYNSRKGLEIKNNPFVALTFYWHDEHRQIRIEGKANLFSKEKSDSYFKSRPFSSQVATVISKQSSELKNIEGFQSEIEILNKSYTGRETELKRPSSWGGIVISATYYEFWQGRPSRIHERLAYTTPATSEISLDNEANELKKNKLIWNKKLLYP